MTNENSIEKLEGKIAEISGGRAKRGKKSLKVSI